MVKIVIAACFVLMLALPALAQEDFPRIQTSMGYANISFPDFASGASARHSGFVNQTSFNLTKTWGLDNYMGIYGLGQGVTLIADFFGGKAMYRTAHVVPYALAGIGVGYFTSSSRRAELFSHRVRRVDIRSTFNGMEGEVSRMGFRKFPIVDRFWLTNSTNFSTGIVFTLSN
jgi:hypothetical protein